MSREPLLVSFGAGSPMTPERLKYKNCFPNLDDLCSPAEVHFPQRQAQPQVQNPKPLRRLRAHVSVTSVPSP